MGHGGYMLLSNNYKYSHSEGYENFKEVPDLSMNEGGLITLKYSDGLLTFTDGKKYAYLKIPLKNPEQELHFGAYLYEIGDEV